MLFGSGAGGNRTPAPLSESPKLLRLGRHPTPLANPARNPYTPYNLRLSRLSPITTGAKLLRLAGRHTLEQVPFYLLLDECDRQRTEERPASGIFGAGGLLIPTENVLPLERDIEALATDLFGQPLELKWNMDKAVVEKLRTGKTQGESRTRMFEIIAKHKGLAVVTLVYDVRGKNTTLSLADMRKYAFDACVQRLNNHVQQIRDSGPHFVLTDTPPEGPRFFYDAYADNYRNPALLPSGKKMRSGKDAGLVSSCIISDATHLIALQAADVSVGCVVAWARAELDQHLHADTAKEKDLRYGRQHMKEWLHVARTGPTGVKGYGLVVWPKDPETHLVRAIDAGLAAFGV